jgi:hypothetical protein
MSTPEQEQEGRQTENPPPAASITPSDTDARTFTHTEWAKFHDVSVLTAHAESCGWPVDKAGELIRALEEARVPENKNAERTRVLELTEDPLYLSITATRANLDRKLYVQSTERNAAKGGMHLSDL